MLTGSMLQKFTKRFQDLSKQKHQINDLPHYKIMQEEFSQSQSHSPQQSAKQDSDQCIQTENQKVETLDKQAESSELRNPQNQQNSGSVQIDEKNDFLKKIKTKLATSKLEKNPENKQYSYLTNSQSNLSTIKKEKIAIQNLPTKQSSDQSEKNAKLREEQANLQQEKKLSDAENSKRKRALVAEVLKETALMDSEQKMNYYRNISRMENFTSTHELKIWIDSLEMVFKVQQQLKKIQEKPDEKTISKKFAQQFIKYVKNNISEKRYKFRRICSIALKQLNLTTQKVDSWLNRFMNQNSKFLKGIDLSEYEISSKKSDQKKVIQEPQISKLKKVPSNTIKQSEKNNNIKQSEKKQVEKKPSPNFALARNTKNSLKQVDQKSSKIAQKSNKNSFQQQSSENQSEDSDQFSKGDQSQSSESLQKYDKQKKMIEKKKKKQQSKKQKQIELKNKKQKKEVDKKKKAKMDIQLKTVKDEQNMYQFSESKQPTYTNYNQVQTKKLPTLPQKVCVQSSAYPESFAKKVAAKLDLALCGAFESILRQKCEQYCVEQQALKEIYENYGNFFMKKNQTQQYCAKYNTPALIPPPSPSPVPVPIPRTYSSTLQLKNNINLASNTNKFSKPLLETSVNRFTPNFEQQKTVPEASVERKKNPSPPSVMPILSHTQMETDQTEKEKVKNTVRMPQESKAPELKPKISPYEILGQKLTQFLRINLGCPEAAIKNQAVRIVTTVPELIGRIREQSLARWLNSFLEKNRQRINLPARVPQQNLSQNPKVKPLTPPSTPKIAIKPYPSMNSSYQSEPRFSPAAIQPQRPVSPIRNDTPRSFHIAPPKRNPAELKGNGVPTQYQYQFPNGQN